MDQNQPAWKLAEAARATRRGEPDAMDRAIGELKPSSTTIAQAYALCFSHPFDGDEAYRRILHSRLQVALMHEHVAAQERMGLTINVLTGVLVMLTLLLVVFGLADLTDRWSSSGWCPW